MSNSDNEPKVPVISTLSAISFVKFDTQQIEPALRYDAWQENISVVFDVSNLKKFSPQDYQATINAAHIGDTMMVLTQAPEQRFCRERLRAWREEADVVLVQLFLRGGGNISGTGTINPGDMLVIDMNQAHEMVNTDFENLTLALPGYLHKDLYQTLEKLHDLRLAHENPLVRLMGEHLLSLWQHLKAMDKVQASIAIEGTLGLLQGWLSRDDRVVIDTSNPAVSSEVSKSIRRHIEYHLDQPLQVEELLQKFRISRAQLYRLFKPYGGVSAYVWKRRLQRSLQMLSQPQFAQMSIAAIAFACGFSSEAHFSRRFQSTFGMRPGKARKEALSLSFDASEKAEDDSHASSNDYSIEFRQLFEQFSTLV